MSKETLPDEKLNELIISFENNYKSSPNPSEFRYGDSHLILSALRELKDFRDNSSDKESK